MHEIRVIAPSVKQAAYWRWAGPKAREGWEREHASHGTENGDLHLIKSALSVDGDLDEKRPVGKGKERWGVNNKKEKGSR